MLMQNEELSRHRYLVDTQCVCLLQELFSSTDKSKRSSISSSVLPFVSGTMAYMVATAATPMTANPRYVAPAPNVSCTVGNTRLTCTLQTSSLHAIHRMTISDYLSPGEEYSVIELMK